MKKKLPLFIFTATAQGMQIIKETEHRKTTDGEKILKNKKYQLEKDCNGVRIYEISEEEYESVKKKVLKK